ncbi:MAG: efflux RND transporter periplasmic adaptor subunit [bacterium]
MAFLHFLRRPLVIISLVILLIGGYFTYKHFSPVPPTFTTVSVVKKPIAEYVTATGSVAPLAKYTLSFERQGKIKEIPVKVGDLVRAGDALAILDDAEAKNALMRAKANEAGAYAKLKQVTGGTRAEEIYLAETALKARELELAQIKALSEANLGTASSDQSAAGQRVSSAQTDLEKTKAKAVSDLDSDYANGIATLRSNFGKLSQALVVVDRTRRLYFESRDTIVHGARILEIQRQAEGYVEDLNKKIQVANDQSGIDSAFVVAANAVEKTLETVQYLRNTAIEDPNIRDTFPTNERTNIEAERASVEATDTAVTNARQNIENQKSANSIAISSAESTLRDAESALATQNQRQTGTLISGSSDVTRAQSAVAEAQAQLKLKRASARSSDVDAALAELDAVKSSVADAEVGVTKTVLRAPVDGVITDISIDIGEVVGVSTNVNPVVTMIAAPPYVIEANIAEIDIPKIKLENGVDINFDAYQGNDFKGHVSEIYPAETVVQGVIYYRIKVAFDDVGVLALPGMTANLKLIAASKDQALVVPYAAVIREGKVDYVRIPNGITFDKREVKVGIQSDTEVEILSGVSEGDKVITYITQN